MLFVIYFNLDQSKILLSDNGFMAYVKPLSPTVGQILIIGL